MIKKNVIMVKCGKNRVITKVTLNFYMMSKVHVLPFVICMFVKEDIRRPDGDVATMGDFVYCMNTPVSRS
jgi:hypothetical protein